MANWFTRSRGVPETRLPSPFKYNGPTSDTSSGSTTVLTAAASALQGKRRLKRSEGRQSWQDEAWSMYDQVGELRYVATAISARMSAAELYIERNGVRQDDEEDPILALITGQLIERLGLNLFVAGDCWLAGLPNEDGSGEVEWAALSTQEVKVNGPTIETLDRKLPRDSTYLTRVWDPHPARWEEADSPVRAALPVLRELVGLTQHTSAQIDSRLAGAGVYWLPNSILNSAKVPEQTGEQSFSENPVLNAIMQAMLLPMEDRSNASSVVPLLMGAPDEAISKIKYESFSTEFDKTAPTLRTEAIRRLALSLDAPPELLEGMGDANHWGMWLVRDEVIQAHVVPRLDLICNALTTDFYRPILAQQNPNLDPAEFTVRADVSQLVQRPNRLADAEALHALNAISDKALRSAGGFEPEDAPSSLERATNIALQVATANPQLLDNMPEIVTAIVALLDGTPTTGPGELSSARKPGSLAPATSAPAAAPEAAPTPSSTQPAEGEPPSGPPV